MTSRTDVLKRTKKHFILLNSILSLTLICGSTATVNAAGNGSTPKGKPFVAIDNQLVEVQGAVSSLQEQMELLVARVATVEERVDADEVAIASLQEQNIALEILVNNNISDIQAIKDKIVLLEQENAALQTSIADNTGDIEALQEQVAANELAISNFQLALIQVENNAISLTDGLQEQIDHNKDLIDLLEQEILSINEALALKQDLINGTCPGGTAVTEVLSDGSVVCGEAGGGGATGELQRFSILKWSGPMAPGSTLQDFAQCPAGTIVSGAGYLHATRIDVISVHVHTVARFNQAYVTAQNEATYENSFFTQASCLRIVP